MLKMVLAISLASLAIFTNKDNAAWVFDKMLLVTLAICNHVWFDQLADAMKSIRQTMSWDGFVKFMLETGLGFVVIILLIAGSYFRCCQLCGMPPKQAIEHVLLDYLIIVGAVIAIRFGTKHSS